ncbi:MAG: hypothetical protein VXV74_00325, partial [Pseudomonadota bacterium]|nr:hypothetical protein [Pseudomonadota bacterium]
MTRTGDGDGGEYSKTGHHYIDPRRRARAALECVGPGLSDLCAISAANYAGSNTMEMFSVCRAISVVWYSSWACHVWRFFIIFKRPAKP